MIAWWMHELMLVRWSHGGSLDEIRWSDLMSARCYQPINADGEKMQDLSRPLAVAITSFEGWFDDVGSQGCDSALACSHEQLEWPFKALVVVACLRKKKMEVFESPLMKTRWMTRECSTSMVWYHKEKWPFKVFSCLRRSISMMWSYQLTWPFKAFVCCRWLANDKDELRMQHQRGVILLVVKLYFIRWLWLVDGGLMMSGCRGFAPKRGVKSDDEDMMRNSRWTRKIRRWIQLRYSSETHKLRDVVETSTLKTGDLQALLKFSASWRNAGWNWAALGRSLQCESSFGVREWLNEWWGRESEREREWQMWLCQKDREIAQVFH